MRVHGSCYKLLVKAVIEDDRYASLIRAISIYMLTVHTADVQVVNYKRRGQFVDLHGFTGNG